MERITEKGIVAGGVEYEVDCIVFATGFEVGTGYTRRAGYDILGRNGQLLSEKWENGPRTLHGMQTADFPNCFFMGFTHTAVTVNVPQALNEQAMHISYMISEVRDQGGSVIEATDEGEQMWVDEMLDKSNLESAFAPSARRVTTTTKVRLAIQTASSPPAMELDPFVSTEF